MAEITEHLLSLVGLIVLKKNEAVIPGAVGLRGLFLPVAVAGNLQVRGIMKLRSMT